VIVASAPPAAIAAKAATSTLPIVFSGGIDPVKLGLVAGLNRPGGNVTGVSQFSTALEGKRLELLHELVPNATVLALLVNPTFVGTNSIIDDMQVAARKRGVKLDVLNASSEREFDAAIAGVVQLRAGALIVASDPFFISRRDQLVALVDDVDGIVALKLESIPSAPKVGAVATRIAGRVSVLGGAGGGDFYHELRRGSDGSVPGAGFPEVFIDVWQAFRAGRVDDARGAFGRALPLIHLSLRSGDTFLWVQKECLRRRGILRTPDLRAPSPPVDPELSAELDDALDDLGVAWARGGAA
jgi:hypothetical protein